MGKTITIVILSVSVLVSIFFVVYANIQTELSKEQENSANELAQDAISLQEYAEKEVQRVLNEMKKLEEELADCKGLGD